MTLRRVLLAGALLCGVAALVAITLVRHALAPAASEAQPVVFRVGRGESLTRIAAHLEARGLVRDARATAWLGRWRGVDASLRAGEFWVSAAQTPDEILHHLATGPVVTYQVVIPEGFTLDQIADRLAAEGLVDADSFRAVSRDPAVAEQLGVEGETLEGYLFPETYHLPHDMSARAVARVLVEHFLAVWRQIEPLAVAQGLSMREVVTLASIIEKETGVSEERPLIASVFRNRLARGMRLETDPTVIYGIPDFDGNLRRRDLENRDNPYNTYVIAGLPPGPIANPGAESLRSVVAPAESDYLFFVSRNDGTHRFSKTFEEHTSAVDRFQRRRTP